MWKRKTMRFKVIAQNINRKGILPNEIPIQQLQHEKFIVTKMQRLGRNYRGLGFDLSLENWLRGQESVFKVSKTLYSIRYRGITRHQTPRTTSAHPGSRTRKHGSGPSCITAEEDQPQSKSTTEQQLANSSPLKPFTPRFSRLIFSNEWSTYIKSLNWKWVQFLHTDLNCTPFI